MPTTRSGGSASSPATALTIEGPRGRRVLSLDELRSLPATEGWGGIKGHSGKIVGPDRYRGVSIAALAELVGGVAPNRTVTLIGGDGYEVDLSYEQVAEGEFTVYDLNAGGEAGAKVPLTAVVAYERDGKALDMENEGTLRLVVLSTSRSLVVDSRLAVRWIRRIVIETPSKK